LIKVDNPSLVQRQSEDALKKMKFNAMKRRLQKYRDLNRDIDNEIERLERLEERAISPSSSNLTGMPKSSGFQDKIAEAAARITELEDEIRDLMKIRDLERFKIERMVKTLSKADERAVIRMRYIDAEDWEQIQFMMFGGKEDYEDKIDNYKQRVFRLHNSAIANLSENNIETD